MSISLKKILFAGTALVAMNYATHAYAQCAVNGAPGTVTINSGNCATIDTDPATKTAISFVGGEGGDPTAYVNDGVFITGNVVTDTDGVGYMNFEGDSTVTGKVGAAGASLNQIWAGGEGATDTFSGDVFAQDIDIGAGIVNFDGNVDITSATTFQFQGAGTANFNGNMVTGDIDFNGYNGNVNFGDAANMTGDIYDGGEGHGNGVVNFAGNSTLTGSIGIAGGGYIDHININGDAGKIVNISGNINVVNDINIGGTGTTNLYGDNITGQLQFNEDGVVNWAYNSAEGFWNGDIYSNGGTVGNGKGSMNITGENPWLDGSFGAGEGVLKEFFFGGDNTLNISGSFYAADTNTINGNIINVGDDFFIGTGQTLNTAITNNEGGIGHFNGNINNNDNTATVQSGTIVDVVVDPSNTDYIGVGDTYTIVAANNVNSNSIGVASVQDTILLDFEQTFPNDDDLVVEIVGRKRISDVVGGGNEGAAGDAIDNACDPAITEGGCSGDIKTLENALLSEDDPNALKDRLESVAPGNDGGATQGALDIEGATAKIVEDEMLALRSGDTMSSGMAAGAAANGASMWLQGYGQRAEQGFHNGVDGYDAYTVGTAIGADSTNIMEDSILGLAFNYAQTNIDSNNVNTTQSQLKNYGGKLYGSHDFGEGVFVNGEAGYASNKIYSTRHNVGGFPNFFGHADYNTDQYAAKAILGRDYAVSGGLTLTPSAMASYTYLKTDGYTETGNAGGLLLTVKDGSFQTLKVGADILAAWTFKNANGSQMKPAIHAGYAYDTIGDNIEESASFVGGGGSFTTSGATPARSVFKAGAGFTYKAAANWDLKADYDYSHKTSYDAHAGTIRATVHF